MRTSAADTVYIVPASKKSRPSCTERPPGQATSTLDGGPAPEQAFQLRREAPANLVADEAEGVPGKKSTLTMLQ
jgi:hypothetical protein